MSDVAVSNQTYAATNYRPVEEAHTHDMGVVSPTYNQEKLQSSVDSALVEALLQMLVGLAQNQGLPKYKLNEIIDFLKNFLSQGGSVGAGGTQPVAGPTPEYGAPIQDDAVHLRTGGQIQVGDKTIIADYPGSMHTMQYDPNTIYLQPGQSVTIGDTQVVAPHYRPGTPVTMQPVISNPVVSQPVQQPGTVSMSPVEFIERYTVRTQMADGSWAPTTNSVALQAFGIPVGTPLNQIDLNNLRPTAGAEGTIFAPRSVSTAQAAPVSQPAAAPATSRAPASAAMQEASGLLAKINNGTATHEDVKAFLSKLQEIAQLFGEAVGDTATQSGRIKGKKGVAAQADAAGGGGGEGSKGMAGLAGMGAPITGAVGGTPTVGAAGGEQVGAASSTGFDTTNGMAGGFTGSTSGKSWLMAIAEAMGNVLGSKVQQMLTSSSRMASLTYDGKGVGAQQDALNAQLNKYLEDHKGSAFVAADYEKLKNDLKPQQEILDNAMKANGQEFTLESSKLQGASQEFSMLQNAFSNAIKSIGEGLGQLARKG